MEPEDKTPLTKSKKSTKKNNIAEPKEIPTPQVEQEEIYIPPKKTRPPKTEKQLEAFQKALDVRKQNIMKKTEQKKIEASKYLLSKGELEEIEDISEDEIIDDEPEVIYLKKPKKKVKRRKQIIIESESESESEPEVIERKSYKSFGKSHRNKKTSIKEYPKQPSQPPIYNPQPIKHNYFV